MVTPVQERVEACDHEGTPPADQPLPIFEDHAGTYVVPFLCRWQAGAWRSVGSDRRIKSYCDQLARAETSSALNPEILG